MSTEKVCRWKCKWWAADPDGEYCYHPKATKYSIFGINLNRARGPNAQYPESFMDKDPAIGVCGPEGRLWEKRPETAIPTMSKNKGDLD